MSRAWGNVRGESSVLIGSCGRKGNDEPGSGSGSGGQRWTSRQPNYPRNFSGPDLGGHVGSLVRRGRMMGVCFSVLYFSLEFDISVPIIVVVRAASQTFHCRQKLCTPYGNSSGDPSLLERRRRILTDRRRVMLLFLLSATLRAETWVGNLLLCDCFEALELI